MKYCIGCGKEVEDHVKFCSHCGGNSFSAVPAADGQGTIRADAENSAPAGGEGPYGGNGYDGYAPYGGADETAYAGDDPRENYGGNAYDYNGENDAFYGRGGDTDFVDPYDREGDYDYPVDEYGNRVDEYGYPVDEYGNRVDEYGNPVDEYGYSVDEYGNRVDAYGNPVDEYGNPVDEYGNPLYPTEDDGSGKKPLMITMISLASVLVVLCVVLVVVFLRKPSRPVGTTKQREIPTGVEPATQSPPVEETVPTTVPTPTYTVPAPTRAYTTKAPTTKAPTTKAPTTKAPTTKAPTTKAPTTKAPTTKAPTTKAPTTKAPTTTAPTTKAPPQPTAPTAKQDIVALYANAVNNVKNGAAGYTMKQVRSIGNVNLTENSMINSILKSALSEAFVPEDSATSTTYSKGTYDAKENIPGWGLQDLNYVTAATCSVSNGNYAVHLQLRDETNPAAGSPLSQVSNMINDYDEINSAIRSALESQNLDVGDAYFDLTYSGYTIDAVITPDGQLVSVRHADMVTVTTHDLVINLGVELNLDNKSFSWSSSKDFTNFTY